MHHVSILFRVEASIKAVQGKKEREFQNSVFATFFISNEIDIKSLHRWHVSILSSNSNQIIAEKIFGNAQSCMFHAQVNKLSACLVFQYSSHCEKC
jgi:hypothetical protein